MDLSLFGNGTVFKVKDYGAAGDGVTDDFAAVHRALDAAIASGAPAVVEFEKDGRYLMSDGAGARTIFDFQFQRDLTLKGDNTTIIMDMEKGLRSYLNINEGTNMSVQGFNFKTLRPVYAVADVERLDEENRIVDIRTRESLGITEGFHTDAGDCFALPYTGEDVNRMHLFYNDIQVLDADAHRYRIQFRNEDSCDVKLDYMRRTGSRLLTPMPNWGQIECGAVVVTHTTNLYFKDFNLWSATHFNFHMRYNKGEFLLKNVNLTPEPGTDMAMVGWRDGFHMKENRAKIVWEDCTLEKVFDDVFNLSCTMLQVTEVISDTEFVMGCREFGGTYWMPLRAGDRITVYNEKTGKMIGRTAIKEVVNQSGPDNHIIVEDPLPGNCVDTSVGIDSVSQPGSVIRRCKVSGSYRFRTPLTVEDSELNTMFAWVDNLPFIEGPVPEHIHFKNCKIHKVMPPTRPEDSFMLSGEMMAIGNYTTTGARAEFRSEDIVFEDCDVELDRIRFMPDADVRFLRDGKEYYHHAIEF